MRNLTNKQLADLKEKWIFYCNHYMAELYKTGLHPSEELKDAAEENELVLKLIDYTIGRKAADKKYRQKGK